MGLHLSLAREPGPDRRAGASARQHPHFREQGPCIWSLHGLGARSCLKEKFHCEALFADHLPRM